jgi:hypothetical protein
MNSPDRTAANKTSSQDQARPACTFSLDLDDRWTYLKTHGNSSWKDFPSYLDIVVPRVLQLLDKHSLRITFFIVGQDAAFERNAGVLRSIADAGHEIGNHSFHHEPWLHLYSRAQIHEELARAEENIEQATGRRPHGFRGPGFSVSDAVVDVLAARGYRYDASTLPTFLGPLARAYYMWTAKLDPEEKKERARLFGRWRDGLRPIKPWFWTTPSGVLAELPVTTIPVVRTPFHLSYLIWLASYSPAIARGYLRSALALCRLTGVPPSFLLHPLDFVGSREAPDLAFFPGMTQSLESKLDLAAFAIETFRQRYRVLTMEDFAAESFTAPLAASDASRQTATFAKGVPGK